MKHKSTKRSNSNKHPHHRSYHTQTRRLTTPINHARTVSPDKIDLGIGTVHLDSHIPCLKPNIPLKSQKILKRDLLRCSNQRPSFLGPQTLQPPRIHHRSQQTNSVTSSLIHSNVQRRHSLSINSRTFYSTIDRVGPWPDISISRLRSDGNDLLRPLKNFRNIKNPRLFSPKYYAALNDNTSKFKFHRSKRTYIEEYRKQKGYLLNIHSTPQSTSLSSTISTQFQQLDDDQLSTIGTFSGGAGNCTIRERSDLSITDLSLSNKGITKSVDDTLNNTNRSPIISSDINQTDILPSIPNQNNKHLRSNRPIQNNQTLSLPTLPNSSFQYLNSMNSVEKVYGNNKKISTQNQSNLYFIDGVPKKRISRSISTTSEITSRSQGYTEPRTTSSPVATKIEHPPITVVYQIHRRAQAVTTQNDVESMS